MRIKKFLLAITLSNFFLTIFSQESDMALWINAGADLHLTSKCVANLDFEYRRKDYIKKTDQLIGSADLNYSVNKFAKIGIGYELIAEKNHTGKAYDYFNRYMFQIPLAYKYRRFSVAWRPRLQATLQSGQRWRENCEYVVRNRFSIRYNIPKLPINPYMKVELFHYLFDNKKPRHHKDRFAAGMEYRISNRQSFALGYMMEPKYSLTNMRISNIIQAAYQISF